MGSLGKLGQPGEGGPLVRAQRADAGPHWQLRLRPGPQLLPSDPWRPPWGLCSGELGATPRASWGGGPARQLKTALGSFHSTPWVLPLPTEKSCRAPLGLGAGVRGQEWGAGTAPGAAHFSPLKTYLSTEITEQSDSFPGLCRPQTASPSPWGGLRGGREVEICKMSVGGEERRFVWGWGPGHWSALRPPAAPSMLPSPGRAMLAGLWPAPGSLQPLCSPCTHCVQASGTRVPGAAQPLRARARRGGLPGPQHVSLLEEAGCLCAGGPARCPGRAGAGGRGALLLEFHPGHHRGPRG